MRSLILTIAAATAIISNAAKVEIPVLDHTVFYDGYIIDRIVDADAEDGILRLSNSLYSVKLDPADYSRIGSDFTVDLTIHAHCDNYDRMGNVRLAFVPKGASAYNEDEVERIELVRLITPFMNKNAKINEVGYTWQIPEAAYIFHDPEILKQYDLWMETYVFGIPYDANNKIKGCKDRNDVFGVTLTLSAEEDDGELASAASGHTLVPLYTTISEVHGNINLNSYNEKACDKVGVTERTFEFMTDRDCSDAVVYLILTNHGAGVNGEEYVRRLHNVYFDNELALTYIPGGVSCEPYRKYNTQLNGIYGLNPKEDWEEWNNWCPGQAVPVRRIPVGAVKAGKHAVRISVPDAQFYGNDGDFRPSLYFQGIDKGEMMLAGIGQVADDIADVKFDRSGDVISFSCDSPVREAVVYDEAGRLLEGHYYPAGCISLEERPAGVYIILVITADGRYATFKTAK